MNSPDYEEFVALLNARGAKYLIVGAHAVAFYAQPRATKDLDLYIESSEQNAVLVLEVIREFFGGYDLGLTIEDLCNLDSVVQLGVAPTRIDLISGLQGVADFQAAWDRRVEGQYGAAAGQYLSLEDLIAAKRSANRGQDRVDLEQLLEVNSGANP